MKKTILIILIAVIIVIALSLGGIYWWLMNPNLSAYEHLTNPQISFKENEQVITVSVSGNPSDISSNAIAQLFQAYYQLEGVDKSKMIALKARWQGGYDPNALELKGEFAMAVPDAVTEAPEGVELKTWQYGETAEILHIGTYDTETPTINKLKDYIEEQGYEISGDHEEEYLKGPMWFLKGNPEKYYTIIRYQVTKK